MASVDISDFTSENECLYDGERYSVRDNGAVFRHSRDGKQIRLSDNKWTFGKENSSNSYLYLANVRIHRVVATAFHGEPPDPKYVVDHIDTNRRNNRPENLRWLTRLENALLNPVTRKKIEYLCGSIEAFLENPSMLNTLQGNPNLSWMRTVTPEEAKNCKERMSLWASSNNKPKRVTNNHGDSFGKRVYKPIQKWEVGFGREPGLELALTSRCAQYMWRADAYFPGCPQDFGNDSLEDYFQNLKTDAVLAYSDHNYICPKLTVIKTVLLKNRLSILVMCKREDHKYSVIGITLDEKTNYFIHFYLGSYPNKDDADKSFSILQESTDWWGKAISFLSHSM